MKNRVFLYLGYDQHQVTVPQIVQFGNAAGSAVPQPADYFGSIKTRFSG